PWGDEAFKNAREKGLPVLLSVGYSTCHWCHVMERESFEDEEVAKLLNDSFVSIKVDREERPDIDSIYMKVCQMMTQGGGWPLTIIMTPDRKPFFAGTYFPKFGRGGMLGIMDLLTQIVKLWGENRDEILSSTKKILSHLEESSSSKLTSYDTDELFTQAFTMLSNQFDKKRGGFGSAPKFPSTHRLLFLLRYWKRYKDKNTLEMVEKTLSEMRLGGMYDHIGYGFHRYSTDENWKVPHFEKMLYDQAMITLAYTETYQATKNINYKKTSEEIISYVIRDMTHPEGGFFSAEDADSEGVEGKFYTWTEKEISTILDKTDAEFYMKIFGFEEKGNFLEEATRKKTGANIPFLQQSLENDSNNTSMKKNERLEQIRTILFNVREKRVHPLKDDKILTDWNGLMIAALAKSARIFQNKDYLAAAEKSAQFILENMQTADGNLLHRYRDGESAISGNLDDYAFFIWGLLELFEASFKTKYLEYAIDLNRRALEKFWDDEVGGFFFTSADSENLLIREKQIYDGAIPSGNSVAMLNLVKLGRILSDPKLEEKADVLMQNFASEV
ncbi:MAG: thioredoxin domain-containing protein, partial [Candidatus Heimdallarchaeota archaeon]|nr:thioredoxin domain-containing protein [Candidatus Heimdallarchaeota archaeon]